MSELCNQTAKPNQAFFFFVEKAGGICSHMYSSNPLWQYPAWINNIESEKAQEEVR